MEQNLSWVQEQKKILPAFRNARSSKQRNPRSSRAAGKSSTVRLPRRKETVTGSSRKYSSSMGVRAVTGDWSVTSQSEMLADRKPHGEAQKSSGDSARNGPQSV